MWQNVTNYYFCKMDLKGFLERGFDYFLPHLSIDQVIIGYQENELRCLLLQIADKWLLPGGYIGMDESVDDAAIRILKERTGLEAPHLQFLAVFGDPKRQFTAEWKEFFEESGLIWKDNYWFNTRFVTLAYYALVNIDQTYPVVGDIDESFAWFPFSELPEMWMDHKSIALEARNRLKADIRQEQVAYNLLPDQFTMPELHQLYQTILEEKLDRSRFQKKMLSTGLFDRLPKLQKKSPGSNPYKYKIKDM